MTAFSVASAPVLTSSVFFGTFAGHERVQLLADCDVALVGQHVEAGVQEPIELAAHGFDDGGCAMSGVEAADATGEIDQAVAVDVFHDRAFGFGDKNRRGVISRLHDGGVAPLHQRLRTRPGNGSAKLNGGHKSVLSSQFSVLSCQLSANTAWPRFY